MVTSNSALEVFFWFVDLTTCGNVIFNTGLCWVYIGWYRAVKKQNLDRNKLPYKAPFAPWAAYWGLFFGFIIVVFVGFDRWKPFDVRGFVTSYFGVAYALILSVVWTLVKKDRFVEPKSADIWSEKDEIDAEGRHWEEISEEEHKAKLSEMNIVARTWNWDVVAGAIHADARIVSHASGARAGLVAGALSF